MFNIFKKTVIALTSAAFVTACSSPDPQPEFAATDKGAIVLEFDNYAGSNDLKLGTNYKNAAGEDFNIDLLQYYISNIKLKDEKGNVYTVPQDQSYFLVKEADKTSQEIKIENVPAGNYTEVTFTIGVDSLRNTSDVSKRTGALDIGVAGAGKEMYWSWNSGYIFFKMEGVSPQINSADKRYRYHIGGFGGYSSKTINNVKTKTLSFGKDKAMVRKDKTPQVHTIVDILKVFNGTTNVSLATNPTVMFSPFSVNVANNYVEAFQYHHLHN